MTAGESGLSVAIFTRRGGLRLVRGLRGGRLLSCGHDDRCRVSCVDAEVASQTLSFLVIAPASIDISSIIIFAQQKR